MSLRGYSIAVPRCRIELVGHPPALVCLGAGGMCGQGGVAMSG